MKNLEGGVGNCCQEARKSTSDCKSARLSKARAETRATEGNGLRRDHEWMKGRCSVARSVARQDRLFFAFKLCELARSPVPRRDRISIEDSFPVSIVQELLLGNRTVPANSPARHAREHHSGNANHCRASGRRPAIRFKFEMARRQSQLKHMAKPARKAERSLRDIGKRFFGPLQFCSRDGPARRVALTGDASGKQIAPNSSISRCFARVYDTGG
jgi:hypothetical protein